MRLDKIRLAGFKSFVDPTTIPLTANLVGIVGPNGCGKSNIIDAVRWVMGESSAKHLRGESMADVIFNGSTTRKPVSQAFVELVFDNSEGDAPGEYAAYHEISIKREVTRDGQSSYFLNGGRCRRKDITDIFLGTGLGARSYAIIEQGTISRLIEARPDEMRAVIEEAAGISRYKDRRHETEIRMRHTVENLERLHDVREEIAKQLGSLQRQAKKAEKYVALKEEERCYREQLLGLRWRKHELAGEDNRRILAECESQFRALVTEDNQLATEQEASASAYEQLQKKVQARQAEFYEVNAESARIDQALKHARSAQADRQRECARLQTEQVQAQADLAQDREQLSALQEENRLVQQALEQIYVDEAEAHENKALLDKALSSVLEVRDAFRNDGVALKSRKELQQSRMQQFHERKQQIQVRRERLVQEQNQMAALLDDAMVESLQESLAAGEEKKQYAGLQYDELSKRLQHERATLQQSQAGLHDLRSELHEVQGKISSLELLQQHAMGKDKAQLNTWLNSLPWTQEPVRLAEGLDVQSGWESAVETILGAQLESLCVNNIQQIFQGITTEDCPETVAFLESDAAVSARARPSPAELPRLLDFVNSPWNLESVLGAIYCASSLEDAWRLRAHLAAHESLVAPDGAWIGPNWLVMRRAEDGRTGVLARERDLRELKLRGENLAIRLEDLIDQVSLLEESMRTTEFEREQRQSEINHLVAELSQINSQLSVANVRREEARKRMQRVLSDLDELADEFQQSEEAWAEAGMLLEQSEQLWETCRQQLDNAQEKVAEQEGKCRDAAFAQKTLQDQLHKLKSRQESLHASEALVLKHLERVEIQYNQAAERLTELEKRVDEMDAPMDEEQQSLQLLLEQRAEIELALGDIRKKTTEAESRNRALSEARMRSGRELEALKVRVETARLDLQANEVRRQAVDEQFSEIEADALTVLQTLPETANETEWQRRVNDLATEINALGAVNLMAKEEYDEQSERMKALEAQYQDLAESQAVLQQAIEKIDRECRTRFKETFERVNSGLQRMFPKLFGGGQAYLELSERDLLETGVSVMARPPGKRNSSIHLLSGGEKALTAVALVFAIFELNPAPFCLLDEVDAPLDDANVGRFSQLVKEMSERVQFLFISHNKATMEIAQHLAGVTMKEPGVSRIVAVDIAEAVELATLSS
jgi:chromosome segregation protein